MMSKNSIVPFLKDYLIKFLTRPFLLDTNDFNYKLKELEKRNVILFNEGEIEKANCIIHEEELKL